MKLDPTGKPIRIRINVGGEEHSTLKSLMDKIKSQDFVVDELCQLWQNGSLARWLVQIGETSTKSKLPESKHGSSPTQLEISRLLACFGIKDTQAVNKKMVEKYKKENNAAALVKALDIMARNGDNDAAFELSGYYLNGRYGIPYDESKSIYYALMAAKKGYAEAQCQVAKDYLQGIGTNKSASEAIVWYEKAIKKGSLEAAYSLGNIYYTGVNNQVEKSFANALQYFMNASKSNYKDSNYYVAKCMFHLGKNRDALIYFNKTVQQSGEENFKAKDLYQFATLLIEFSPNDSRIEAYFLKSAERGYPEAQSHLGWLYCIGKYGIKKNETEGFKWIKKAASAGDSLGQKLLGDCYKNGVGIMPQQFAARTWYTKAALQGHEGALKELLAFLANELVWQPNNYLKKELRIAIKQASNNGMKEAQDFVRKYSNWLK